jgi:hypothetical protein
MYEIFQFFLAYMLVVRRGFFLLKLTVVRAEFSGNADGLALEGIFPDPKVSFFTVALA